MVVKRLFILLLQLIQVRTINHEQNALNYKKSFKQHVVGLGCISKLIKVELLLGLYNKRKKIFLVKQTVL